MKIVRLLIIVFGVVLASTLPFLGLFFDEERVVGEVICVDGLYHKNLEGIMCEDVEVFTFGMDQSQFALLTIPCAVIGLLIFSLGLNMEDSRRRTPKDTIGKVKE